jgi:hypothetical protein
VKGQHIVEEGELCRAQLPSEERRGNKVLKASNTCTQIEAGQTEH